MQDNSIEDIRSEHGRTGRAPGKVTLSTWPSRFFISFLIVGVFSFAGLIAYIVTTQQADPEVLQKMEQIKEEIAAKRQEALRGAPGYDSAPDSLSGLEDLNQEDASKLEMEIEAKDSSLDEDGPGSN